MLPVVPKEDLLLGALSLEGFWSAVVLIMLAGYFLASKGIWLLCVGTHSGHASILFLR